MEKSRTKPKLVLPENERASLSRRLERKALQGDSNHEYTISPDLMLVPESDTFLQRLSRNLNHYVQIADKELKRGSFQWFKVSRAAVLAAQKTAMDFIN